MKRCQLFPVAILLAALCCAANTTHILAADAPSEFSTPTIDLGCVVADGIQLLPVKQSKSLFRKRD